MVRTQIYLTHNQHRVLREKAFKENTTTSEIMRNLIDKELLNKQNLTSKTKNVGEWLIFLAREAKQMKVKAPADLASNLDKYLYGEK